MTPISNVLSWINLLLLKALGKPNQNAYIELSDLIAAIAQKSWDRICSRDYFRCWSLVGKRSLYKLKRSHYSADLKV